jgi:hypothetical protein
VAHLNSPELSILHAIFAMGLLTLIMGGWMSIARDIGMRRAGLKLQEAAHTRELAVRLPSWARRVSDNYNHLLEAPTIFYATALAIVVGGLADTTYSACAWAFLGLRVLHSLVQATFNRVAVRAIVYGLSWIPLAAMIVRPLLTLA